MKYALLLALLMLSHGSLNAAALSDCEKQINTKTQRLLRNYTDTIRIPARDPVEQLQRLERAESRLLEFIDGKWAGQCQEAAGFLNDIRKNALRKAKADAKQQTLERCERHMDELLSPFENARHQSLAARNGERLITLASDADTRLKDDEFLQRCPGYRPIVQAKRAGTIAQTRALGEHIGKLNTLDYYFPGVKRTSMLIRSALSGKLHPAPDYLTEDSGQQDFAKALQHCQDAANTLLDAGVPGELAWYGQDSQLTLADTTKLCATLIERLPALRETITKFNAHFDSNMRSEWETRHLRTKVMKSVYRENRQAIPIVTESDKGPVWQYRYLVDRGDFHQCRSYYFDKTGKRLRDLRVSGCQ